MEPKKENMKDKQRLGQLKNLVMLASADENVTDSEMAVLIAVASREDITPEEFNKVMDDPDGELDEHEMAICKLYAMALGYRGSIVDGMIAGVIDKLDAQEAATDE